MIGIDRERLMQPEQLTGPVPDQPQVTGQAVTGFLEVGGGFLQRQRQVPQQHRQRIPPGRVVDTGAMVQNVTDSARVSTPSRRGVARAPHAGQREVTSTRPPPPGGSNPASRSGCSALSYTSSHRSRWSSRSNNPASISARSACPGRPSRRANRTNAATAAVGSSAGIHQVMS